jgi:homoaconitate hydratase
MGQTVVEKIAQEHMTSGPEDRPLKAGDFLTIRPLHVMTHDNTAPVMKKFRAIDAPRVLHTKQPVFVLDHDIQNRSEENLAKYSAIKSFAKEQGVEFYPPGSGIGHQVMCEQLYVVPGSFVVASDSHSNMYGAMSAVGTPVVRTDAAAIWATGEFWWQIPRSVQVVFEGALPEGATGKDIIIALCGRYNQGEVLNAAVEFTGPGVASLTMDARMTISNMTTEWGALVGWFPCDAVTVDYVRKRRRILSRKGIRRINDEQLDGWKKTPVGPDEDATYAARITFDLSEVTPHVSGPDTVQTMTSLAELEAQQIKINKAYLVSCVNSRVEDLEAAAKVLEEKQVARRRARGKRCSMRAPERCRRGAARASVWAPGFSNPARWASRQPTGTSRAAWDRATRGATSRVPRWWPPPPSPVTSPAPKRARAASSRPPSRFSRPRRPPTRRCGSSTVSRRRWADDSSLFRRTTSTPTASTGRTTPIATA